MLHKLVALVGRGKLVSIYIRVFGKTYEEAAEKFLFVIRNLQEQANKGFVPDFNFSSVEFEESDQRFNLEPFAVGFRVHPLSNRQEDKEIILRNISLHSWNGDNRGLKIAYTPYE